MTAAALVPLTRRLPADDGSRQAKAARRRARELRLAWLYFALALAVASVTLGAFLSGFEWFAKPESGLYAAGWFLGCTILIRFPRSLGIPAFFLVLASTLALPLLGESWHFLRGDTHVATVRILNIDDDRVEAEWRSAVPGLVYNRDSFFKVDGSQPVIGVRVVRIPRGVFFLAADALIRLETVQGATGDEERPVTGEAEQRFGKPDGIAGRIAGYLVSGRIPGLQSRLETARIRRPVVLSDYRVHAGADGEILIAGGRDMDGI